MTGAEPFGAPTAAVVRELAPTGRLRAAINYGNPVLARPDPATGRPQGISVDLARELAARLGVNLDCVTFDAAGKVFEALESSIWDVAFLAIDPVRAAGMSFTAPYLLIEGTYVVPAASPLRDVDGFDRTGVRIAVGRGAAYDLFLTRTLKRATLVRADTSSAALDLFLDQRLDAAAGVRQTLMVFAQAHPGLRVLDRSFTSIRQAMAIPNGRELGLRYVERFVEEMKASGFVAAALGRSGQTDALVAPAVGPR